MTNLISADEMFYSTRCFHTVQHFFLIQYSRYIYSNVVRYSVTHTISPGGIQPHGDQIPVYVGFTIRQIGLDER